MRRPPAWSLFYSLLLSPCACTGQPSTPAAAAENWQFDDTRDGTIPDGWRIDATRPTGPLASWAVHAEPTAPTPPQVLSLTYPNHRSYDSFNLCWSPAIRFGDGSLAVRLRAVSGKEDQGGGLIWRVRDADHYYVVRLNPLEGNLRLYHVVGGNRTMLASADCAARAGEWHDLRVDHGGSHITCAVDGRRLIEVDDTAIGGDGGVGFWTKADAATDFDDLRIARR